MKEKKPFITLLCLCITLCFCACANGAKVKPSLGHVSNNVYESEFIGIGCKLDDKWTFLSNEEILAQNQLTMDMVGGEYKDIFEAADILADMIATHSNGTDSINIQLEKLSSAHSSMSVQQYIDASKDQISGPLQSLGIKNIVLTKGEMDFAGEKRPCLTLVGDYNGVSLYEAFVPIKCPGGYMACVTVGTWYQNTTADVLSNFYALN